VKARAATPDEIGWIASRTGYAFTAGARAIAAVDSAGEIRGMVAFDAWTESGCQCHVALDAPIAARTLRAAFFEYLGQVGRSLALGLVPAHRARSVALAKRMGFVEKCRIADGWAAGDDLLILELRLPAGAEIERRKAA